MNIVEAMFPLNMVTVIEHSQISPPPGVGDMSLPLSFFDVPWLYYPPTLHLRFYQFPNLSKSHFTGSIVPNLKRSLSLTLKYYLPFAGNLVVYPSTTSKPEICYKKGDSVSVTFANCSKDFDHLTGNHARNANDFRNLVPHLAPIVTTGYCSKKIPILAIQVTLFPNSGISIGFANLHVIGDASTTLNFIRALSSVTKFRGDEQFLASGSLPFYNKAMVNDPHSLATKCLNEVGVPKFEEYPHHVSPNLVRSTYIMTQDQIKQLKESTLIKLPTITHLSSFTVVCAYVWSCIAKSRASTRNLAEADQVEVFVCSADFRTRLDPPLPPTYFGNCILPCAAISKCINLIGEGGYLKAVELIGDAIFRTLNSKNAVLEGMEEWIQALCSRERVTAVGVAGSPKFNFYDTDFGWGKPKKYEVVSIDSSGSISLNAEREFGRDVEIGLCLTQPEMDAFGDVFSSGLRLGRP